MSALARTPVRPGSPQGHGTGDDAGLRFWLRYVESAGGLWDAAGDTVLIVLPPRLQADFQLADELVVTADPDVAREDGATFIAAGHPVLGRAAETVLTGGDAGLVALPAPASVPPDAATLLARARDQVPVDHGRIDLAGAVTRGTRPVLRIGALASYTISTEDHFQERLEAWVDVVSRLQLPARVSTRLAGLAPEAVVRAPELPDPRPAVAAAHRLIDAAAADRQRELSGQVSEACARERDRTRSYYAEALDSIRRRQATAPPDRQELYAARAESTRQEQARRLAEIEEKYQARHEIRPYRLHVVQVPVLRLPVVVRRGSRPYPLVLDWQLPVAAFAELRCPACGEPAPLVAAKTKLGCERCVARAPAEPVPTLPTAPVQVRPPRPTAVPSAAPARPQPLPPPLRSPARPVVVSHSPGQVRKAGENLGYAWWEAAAAGGRRLSRLVAPESPAAALVRLYGAAGPAVAIGVGAGEEVSAVSAAAFPPGRGEENGLESAGGRVSTGRFRYAFQLRWRYTAGVPLVEEVLPYGVRVGARLPSPRYLFTGAAARMFHDLLALHCEFDRVAAMLWARVLLRHGLPIVLRCPPAWWRVADDHTVAAAHPPAMLAASVERMVCLRPGSPGGRYDEAAAAYHVDEQAVRAASTALQKRLQLSRSCCW
ncbi:MAG TPA: hypothetical protein VLJ59_14995 [Mycobacteriales bacterium]|nr:hypothetical protein [Mycobacteriales bacterium]